MSDSEEDDEAQSEAPKARVTMADVSSDDGSEIYGEGFTLASRDVKKRMMAAAASRVREGAPRASLTEAGPGVTCSASGGGPTHVDIKVRAANRTLTPATCTPLPRSDALSRLLTATALTLSTAGAAADVDAAADAADVAAAAAAELAAAALRAAVAAAARSRPLFAGRHCAAAARVHESMSGCGVCKDARARAADAAW
jgi:hypothetical protein